MRCVCLARASRSRNPLVVMAYAPNGSLQGALDDGSFDATNISNVVTPAATSKHRVIQSLLLGCAPFVPWKRQTSNH